MNSQANGFATATFELVHGYPAYFYTPGDGTDILGVDEEHGLPIRTAGDCDPNFEWICGFNRAVVAHVGQHGLPWNSRQASLEVLSDLPGYFRHHAPQSTRLVLNGEGFMPPGLGFALYLEDDSNVKERATTLRLECQSLFIDPKTVPHAMWPYRGGPPPAESVTVPQAPALSPGTCFLRHWPIRMADCVECVPAPPGSNLVVFRFSQFVRKSLLPYSVQEEMFLALDTQLAEWIPSHLLSPMIKWPRR